MKKLAIWSAASAIGITLIVGSSPFVIFPLALKFNQSPSIPVAVLHNYVLPVMSHIDPDNGYMRLWRWYTTRLCRSNPEECIFQENAEKSE